jgi:putative endonuclease
MSDSSISQRNQLKKNLIAKYCPKLPVGSGVAWSNWDELPSKADKFYVYVILCENGKLYRGYSSDLRKRYSEHLTGTGARFTRSFKPICLLYFEEFSTKSEAMSREYYFKNNGRKNLREILGNIES